MKFLKTIYCAISYLLLGVHIFFLLFAISNKIFIGKVLYYGNSNNAGYEGYFNLLVIAEHCLAFLTMSWIAFTLLMVVTNNFNIQKLYTKIGISGLVITVIVFMADPFGIWQYLAG